MISPFVSAEPAAPRCTSLSSIIAEGYRRLGLHPWHIRCSPPYSERERPAPAIRTRAVSDLHSGGGSDGVEEVSVAKEDRGFASMDRQKQREIASKGGKAAHAKGTAHEWTSEEAREAGRKGGMASHRRRKEMSDGTDDSAQGSGSDDMSGMSGSNEQIR